MKMIILNYRVAATIRLVTKKCHIPSYDVLYILLIVIISYTQNDFNKILIYTFRTGMLDAVPAFFKEKLK